MKSKAKKLLIDWKIAVKERDNYTCQICGQTNQPNAHHIVDKKFKEFKFDVENGLTVCPGCHTFRFRSAHKNPLWFVAWFKTNHPERYDYLMGKVMQKIKEDAL